MLARARTNNPSLFFPGPEPDQSTKRPSQPNQPSRRGETSKTRKEKKKKNRRCLRWTGVEVMREEGGEEEGGFARLRDEMRMGEGGYEYFVEGR